MRLTMFDPAPIGVVFTRGPEHRLAYTNAVYRKTFGDRPLGRPLRRTFPDLAQSGYFDIFDRVLATGEAEVLTAVPIDLDFADSSREGTRYFTFSVSRATVSDGSRGVLGVVVETTEQVTAARRIRVLSEERRRALLRYRSLVRAGSEMVWVTGPEGGVTEPSPGWQRVTGQSWEEFRGDGWIDAIHPDDRAAVVERWSRALREVQPRFTHAYRLRLATGGYRHFGVDAAPVRDGDRVIEWIGTCRDVEQEWQDARREKLLARATAVTADTARPDEMLAALTAVIVPELADSCTSYLLPQALHRTPGTALAAERVAAVPRQGPPGPPPHQAEHLGPDSALVRAADRRRPVHAVFRPGSPPPDITPTGTDPGWRPTPTASSCCRSSSTAPPPPWSSPASTAIARPSGHRRSVCCRRSWSGPTPPCATLWSTSEPDRWRSPSSTACSPSRRTSPASASPSATGPAARPPKSAATGTTPSCCATTPPSSPSVTSQGTTCPPRSP
ncbi:PAS domain-containing protein [Streptomyces sp. DSM 41931]|uniref:PAS domain-containing protein n=1 Tax=Streptomyces sp. DSM 41931 TaxID=3418367 RepID=UPI003CFD3BA6